MKRFLIFAGEVYYPEGGASDFKSDHSSLKVATELAQHWRDQIRWHNPNDGWAHVWDSRERKIVAEIGQPLIKNTGE